MRWNVHIVTIVVKRQHETSRGFAADPFQLEAIHPLFPLLSLRQSIRCIQDSFVRVHVMVLSKMTLNRGRLCSQIKIRLRIALSQ